MARAQPDSFGWEAQKLIRTVWRSETELGIPKGG